MRKCEVCGTPFNWAQATGRPPTVCSDHCRFVRKNHQREASRRRAIERGCPPNLHGTCRGYTQYKCDCPLCKKWSRDYKAAQRSAAKAAVQN